MDNEENKIRRDSCCQSTSQGDELQRLQLCFLMILLALFYSVFWLHLNLVNKTTEAGSEHAHHNHVQREENASGNSPKGM